MDENTSLLNVKLVTENGVKEMSFKEAFSIAEAAGMDLVLMNENEGVCKVIDYSKYLYNQKKAKKVQKGLTVKEIKFSPGIAEHDLNIKIKSAVKMLSSGCRVRVSMCFKGREVAYMDNYKEIMSGVLSQLSSSGKVYSPLKKEGNNWVFVMDKK